MSSKAREKFEKRLAELEAMYPKPVPWTPFQQTYLPPEVLEKAGIKKQPVFYRNSRYQVNVRPLKDSPGRPNGMVHLSIKRIDKGIIHDWRDLQRIKNEICGEDREAVEIYPAESRLVDDANQYHIFVYPKGYTIPFGFAERSVSATGDKSCGSFQRPFEPDAIPEDAKYPNRLPPEDPHARMKEL